MGPRDSDDKTPPARRTPAGTGSGKPQTEDADGYDDGGENGGPWDGPPSGVWGSDD